MLHHLIGAVLVLALVSLFEGCSTLTSSQPSVWECKGKGTITATGYGSLGAGVTGQEANTITINADCGDGFFVARSQTPLNLSGTMPAPAPVKTP
jgi:hypothetical protein